MTALAEYQRLEATALWRATSDAQRREVIVALGDATLTITDVHGAVLAHWSLAAVARANPGKRPAVFHPDGDPGETLELTDDEAEMITAIERLRTVIERRRPHPGRLRFGIAAALALGFSGLAVFWLPGALVSHTVKVVPQVKRVEIGAALLGRITRVAGAPCAASGGVAALDRLSLRLLGQPDGLRVLPGGLAQSAHLPGGTIIINRSVVEDWEEPEVAAGFVVAELARMRATDPLRALLEQSGFVASLRLLTTGQLSERTLDAYAEARMSARPVPLPDETLLTAFAEAGIHSSPYAYALDTTGETTLTLIEADPYSGSTLPSVLEDSDWIRLQAICET